MGRGIPRPSLGGLPRKTAFAVAWFALMGGAALVVWKVALEPPGRRDAPGVLALSSPLPAPVGIEARPDEEEEVREIGTRAVDAGPPREPHQPIEDPGDRGLCGFFESLARLAKTESDPGAQKVRVVHYGDSILTTDELSGQVRRLLQERFGDGGHGFVLLGKPWRWYHHLDVEHGARGDWRVRPLTSDPVSDGLYGLGGVAFETRDRGAAAWAGTVPEGAFGTSVTSFDISYLAQPGGGSLDLILDGALVETVSTAAAARSVVHRILNAPAGRGKLTVRARGDGAVRLFGAVLENDRPGVVYDSLAINGARASVMARIDPDHWKSELSKRRADLVVLMFGANEGHNEWLALREYGSQLGAMLDTIREALPEAACLVVGPLDQATRDADGQLGSRRMPRRLTKAQRDVSLAHGCAFFDTYQAMGGENSMAKWYQHGLGGGDLIHPTEYGARRIGSWLADALLAGYERFLYGGARCAVNTTS